MRFEINSFFQSVFTEFSMYVSVWVQMLSLITLIFTIFHYKIKKRTTARNYYNKNNVTIFFSFINKKPYVKYTYFVHVKTNK